MNQCAIEVFAMGSSLQTPGLGGILYPNCRWFHYTQIGNSKNVKKTPDCVGHCGKISLKTVWKPTFIDTFPPATVEETHDHRMLFWVYFLILLCDFCHLPYWGGGPFFLSKKSAGGGFQLPKPRKPPGEVVRHELHASIDYCKLIA